MLPPETPTSSRALISSASASPNPEHYCYSMLTDSFLSQLDDELITPHLLGNGLLSCYDRTVYLPSIQLNCRRSFTENSTANQNSNAIELWECQTRNIPGSSTDRRESTTDQNK